MNRRRAISLCGLLSSLAQIERSRADGQKATDAVERALQAQRTAALEAYQHELPTFVATARPLSPSASA